MLSVMFSYVLRCKDTGERTCIGSMIKPVLPEECLLISLGCISGWGLWSECLVSPANTYVEILNPQGDSIWKWGLWEVIRS